MNLLLTPPIVFLILLAVVTILSMLTSVLGAAGKESAGKGRPYASGQDVPTGRIQPSYGEFFPFAFFFTIMHVTALVLGTVPGNAVWLSVPFLLIAVLALVILFRRD
ncbi:MAG: hypothetical protein FWF44_05220 [Defluviitaleaceae bacterium]|nr:hypothetical protein [Defluviitaleaceae bacterium]